VSAWAAFESDAQLAEACRVGSSQTLRPGPTSMLVRVVRVRHVWMRVPHLIVAVSMAVRAHGHRFVRVRVVTQTVT